MQPFQFLKNLIPSMCSILVSLFGRVPLRTVPSTMVKVKVAQSCPTLCDPMDYTADGILQAGITGVGSHSLLQGIFPTQGLYSCLPHCRWILYQLSQKGSPRILEWVAQEYWNG